MRLTKNPSRRNSRHLLRLGVALGLWQLAACQPRGEAETSLPPPVGHYEGSLSAPGQPALRAALDVRHPRPGHYEAEFTVPTAGTLSFVADTLAFSGGRLRLVRPARPGQVLTLTLDGDFWRGALALDSLSAPAILVKRGAPAPSAYRATAVSDPGPAWLFAPTDTGTAGPALALLPDAETAPAAALWADALAREGVIVLVLPAPDSATGPAAPERQRLRAALRLLRGTAGADTANVGIWAAGARAASLAPLLLEPDGPRAAFFIVQNLDPDPASRAALREMRGRRLPLLGLAGGEAALRRAAALRGAVGGGRRGATVHAYRTARPDLLVPGTLGPRLAPGLPADVVEWLRGK